MQSSRSLRSLGHLTAPRLCYRKATAPSNAAYCGVSSKKYMKIRFSEVKEKVSTSLGIYEIYANNDIQLKDGIAKI